VYVDVYPGTSNGGRAGPSASTPVEGRFKLEDWQLAFTGIANASIITDASGQMKFGVPLGPGSRLKGVRAPSKDA
jgi:hypothetical protein